MAPASTRASINTNYTTGRRRPLVLVLLLALVLGALHSAAAGTASSSAAAAGPAAAAAGGSQRRPRFLSAHARARSPPLAMASGANPIAALKSLAAAYGNWLYREPLKANVISGIAMVAAGDVISQFLETDERTGRKRASSLQELEPRRIANAGFAGAFWNGLMLPWWYQFIHRVLPVDNARTIAMKIMGNCVVWGCAGNAAIMLMRRTMDGEPLASATAAVKRDLWPVMKNDYKIWPLYDVLCFTMIPRHMQALTTGTLGICWATYLSFVTHTEGHESAAPAPAPVVAAAK